LDITDERIKKYSEKSKKENNPERAKKISETQKQQFEDGIRSNNGENNPMFGKKHSAESRDKQRKSHVFYLKNKLKKSKTNLEKEFIEILEELNLKYIFQYILDSYLYDFYLIDYNTIIETDGDWWHVNPLLHEAKSEIQFHTIEHDKIKNEVCKKNNIKLLRFWESDIKNNKLQVIKILIEELNL
jgi:very-short-patch-repair endonuclease